MYCTCVEWTGARCGNVVAAHIRRFVNTRVRPYANAMLSEYSCFRIFRNFGAHRLKKAGICICDYNIYTQLLWDKMVTEPPSRHKDFAGRSRKFQLLYLKETKLTKVGVKKYGKHKLPPKQTSKRFLVNQNSKTYRHIFKWLLFNAHSKMSVLGSYFC